MTTRPTPTDMETDDAIVRRIIQDGVLPFLRSGMREAVVSPADFAFLRRSVQPQFLRVNQPTPRQPYLGYIQPGTPSIVIPLTDGGNVLVFTWVEW